MLHKILALTLAIFCYAGTCAQTFAILSDIHVNPGNRNEAYLKQAIQEINSSDVQVVLLTGDLCDDGSDVQLNNVKHLLADLTKPLYVIPGNHENTWSQSNCTTFNHLWGDDRFVFTIDSLVVIGLNCGPFMKMGDGHIKQEDLLWLDNTLKNTVKPGYRVLSINHYPLLDDLDNYADYVSVLQKYPVIAHQGGHYHAWKHYNTGGINGIVVRALYMNDKDGGESFGYTRLLVDKDSIHVYDKVLGVAPRKVFGFPISTNFEPVARPELRLSEECGYNTHLVLADTASIFTRIAVDSDNVYYGNSLGYTKAVSKVDGHTVWAYKTSGMLFSRPQVSGNSVLVPTSDRRLLWLNRTSGNLIFVHQSATPYAADGVVHKGILYQGGGQQFQAWDVAKHKLLWSYDSLANYAQASATVSGDDVVFGAWDSYLRSLDMATGKLRWKWSNGKHRVHFAPGNVVPVVLPDRVVIVAPDRYMTCIDRKTGRQIWRWNDPKLRVRESLGVSTDGKLVYAKTMDGLLVAIDPHGDQALVVWTVDLKMGYEHAPCPILVHEGVIFCGSRRGEVVLVSEKKHEVLVSYKLGTSEVNGFEVDPQGAVYCSLVEGKIYRISR